MLWISKYGHNACLGAHCVNSCWCHYQPTFDTCGSSIVLQVWYNMIGHWTRSWSLIKYCHLDVVVQSHNVWCAFLANSQRCQLHWDVTRRRLLHVGEAQLPIGLFQPLWNKLWLVQPTNWVPNNDIHSLLGIKWKAIMSPAAWLLYSSWFLVWVWPCETALLPNSVLYQWNTKHKILAIHAP